MNKTWQSPIEGGARLPEELVASSAFLLKRLGYAAKQKAIEGYEREGLSPYQYAILALLAEGVRETEQDAILLGFAARMAALFFAIMEDRISKQVR